MKIGHKIRFGLLLITFLACIAGYLAISALVASNTYFSRSVDETIPLVDSLGEVRQLEQSLILSTHHLIYGDRNAEGISEGDNARTRTQLNENLEALTGMVQTHFPESLESIREIQAALETALEINARVMSEARLADSGETIHSLHEDLINAHEHFSEAFQQFKEERDATLMSRRERLRSSVSTLITRFSALFAIIVIVGILLALGVSGNVSRRFDEIQTLVQEVGQGQYGKELPVSSADEFSSLARSINQMSQDLRVVHDELAASQGYTEKVFQSLVDGMMIITADGSIVRVNQALSSLSGFPEAEMIGMTVSDLLFFDAPDLFDRMKTEAVTDIQGILKTESAGEVPVSLSAAPVDVPGTIVCMVRDITSRKLAEEQILYLAYHDSLTALPNRALFLDRLAIAAAQAERFDHLIAVIFIGLDNFKHVNETLGHRVGDLVLQAVAERLQVCVRKVDTVTRQDVEHTGGSLARLGGDEFIILASINNAEDAAKVAQRILGGFPTPFIVDEQEIFLSASIGIAIYPGDAEEHEQLISSADTAMHSAKNQGKNTYKFFQHSMNVAAFKRLTLESSLRKALERQEFVLHYQPQLDLRNGDIVGLEALIRWRHPEMGMVPPDDFIPLAEETGLITPIGEWVIHSACRQAGVWRDAGYRPVRISVNLSSRQFKDRTLGLTIEKALSEAGLGPEVLGLEITESIVMQDTAATVAILNRLHEMGLKVSVDDFGTGYSSLSYLKKFPLHAIKIDRSFIRDIPGDQDDEAIAQAVTAMGSSLNLRVIAEGVETPDQLSFLKAIGCHEIQGYLLSPPVSADDIVQLISEPGQLIKNRGYAECLKTMREAFGAPS